MEFTERMFREVLGMFPTGVAVVTARSLDGSLLGVTVNSFNSVSLDPPLVLFSLSRRLYSLHALLSSPAFAINFLHEDQQHLSARFNRALSNKWENVTYSDGVTGAPVLSNALAVLEAEPYAQYDGGDHVIVVLRVVRIETRDVQSPLVYFRGRYHKLVCSHDDDSLASSLT